MNCPRCGNPVNVRSGICEVCSYPIAAHRRIYRVSNSYYNRGLECAKVRNLTGAVYQLKKSLELNKNNTRARNLLGLVYLEMGEIVMALTEWVISKHFQPEKNDADYFLSKVQDNAVMLDNMNQAIKKFNIALAAAKEDKDDLAIIQLKKVVSMYPNFLKAKRLLALLYIKDAQYRKAEKLLKEVLKTDVADTVALRYMAEIKKNGGGTEEASDRAEAAGNGITPTGSYKEEKVNYLSFINLILGVIVGIGVVYYLIVPTIESKIKEEYKAQAVDYSAEISLKNATLSQNERTINKLNNRVAALEDQLEHVEQQTIEVEVDNRAYDELFSVWAEYLELMSREYSDDELIETAVKVTKIDSSIFSNEDALRVLKGMQEKIYPLAARKTYKRGRAFYDAANYEEAVTLLEASVAMDGEADATLYYLGKTLQALERYEEAIASYKKMLEVCPNSTLKDYIPQRLRECGYTE